MSTFLLGAFFCFSNFIGAITGFGSTIIGLALSAHFFAIPEILPIIVPVDLILSSYILSRYYKYVDLKTLFRSMLPTMAVGFVVGIFASKYIQGNWLKTAFGIFIFVYAAWQLIRIISKKHAALGKMPLWESTFFLLGGGVFMGIYASGGPWIVGYASRQIPEKHRFRSTLALLWLIMNTAMLGNFYFEQRLNAGTLMKSFTLVPFVILGIALGDRVHRNVSQESFRTFVFVLLCLVGISLFVSI